MSEAMKFSLSPRPMRSGQPARASTMQSGSWPHMTRERVGTPQLRNRLLHRLEQVVTPVEVIVDAVRDDLGVGVRGEFVAGFLELVAQLLVILDDPVVARSRRRRARCAGGRSSRSGRHASPSAVGDAEVAGGRVRGERVGELRDLADGAQPRDVGSAVQDGARRPSRSHGIRGASGPRSGSGRYPGQPPHPTMPHMRRILTRCGGRRPRANGEPRSGPGRIPSARPGSWPQCGKNWDWSSGT